MENETKDLTQNETLTEELIDRLRTYCEAERGRSRDLAIELGIAPSSLSDWLYGRTVPDLEHGLRVQQILRRKRVPRARHVRPGQN